MRISRYAACRPPVSTRAASAAPEPPAKLAHGARLVRAGVEELADPLLPELMIEARTYQLKLPAEVGHLRHALLATDREQVLVLHPADAVEKDPLVDGGSLRRSGNGRHREHHTATAG